MATIYVTEPPTDGRILLVTSKGDIEIELWAKEAPKACRNIIALALEGYYDNCIFHRVVPGFCIQTGDPSGTGMGGESFYGEPFENEPHQRLKFTKRGMVAMANTGEFATNESQFFITLDATPELQGKFTVFGRVAGQTIYNALAIAEVELRKDEPDRPVYPPKLLRVDVLQNPFDDIVPRITRDEKRQQMKAKREAAERKAKEREKKSVKKNTALLSFGEAEETTGEQLKGPKSSHDLLSDKKLSKQPAVPLSESGASPGVTSAISSPAPAQGTSTTHADDQVGGDDPSRPKKRSKHKDAEAAAEDLASLRANTRAKETAADQIRTLEASIRGLTKQASKAGGGGESREAEKKVRRGRQLLEEARAKYLQATKAESSSRSKLGARAGAGAAGDDDETLRMLAKFQSRMRDGEGRSEKKQRDDDQPRDVKVREDEAEIEDEDEKEGREYGASDDDDGDAGWRNHRLDAGGIPLSGRQDKFTVDDYEVLDPRNEPKASHQDDRRQQGKRGRDWVEERNWSHRSRNGGNGGASSSYHGRRPEKHSDEPRRNHDGARRNP
ncbi:uncharacterized protein PFL1_00853 [Pseudozyma flocculosa PF-1]|uniref:Related to Cyclophilin-16 n=1 Tax=Pseudozyma flocculosa TaxID=84751 RepID=A0A5C3F2Y9_9BASI|nr:uncharacterized protein PFL1_00853 [Pseudozyma flocculosa PF-1]EPQ31520.1 hypothetical protein PFL1_00853 [Pseudozyma flocculosa PF-1]SPO38692.1 related to Cyclophilin-16 [Pseudozyma flocculosa]